jgi:hypothetical protein
MAALIPLGVRRGVMVHISEVDRGLDCDCTCPECGAQLIARKGEVREPHFAHHGATGSVACAGGVETALHKYAKQIIAAAGYLELPGFSVQLPPPDHDMLETFPERRATFEHVVIEERMALGRRRVDVVGHEATGRILIEICVTHRVHGRKLEEVQAAEEAMVEIKIMEHQLFAEDAAWLHHRILDAIDGKRWIFHPEGEAKRAALNVEAQRRRRQRQKDDEERVARARVLRRSEACVVSGTRGSGHLPSREGQSPEDYVRALEEFLRCYVMPPSHVIRALKLSGYITLQDIELSRQLGGDLPGIVAENSGERR